MRIISGTHRGRIIKAPANLPVRPTTDFAKTGLFNILNNQYNFFNIKVLDLFSGIGSFTLEFLSRGSKQIIAVDKDSGCNKFLRQQLFQLNAPASVIAVQNEVFHFLKRCNESFDIIIADPPFDETPATELISLIFEQSILTERGVFVLEHASENSFDELPHFVEKRKYGNVTFSFFRNENK